MVDEAFLAFLCLVAFFVLIRLIDCWAALPYDKNWKWLLSCLFFRRRVYEDRAVLFERIMLAIIFIYALFYTIISVRGN